MLRCRQRPTSAGRGPGVRWEVWGRGGRGDDSTSRTVLYTVQYVLGGHSQAGLVQGMGCGFD